MAIQANRGYGFRDVTFNFLADAPLFSQLVDNTFDVRDFGLKTLTATGSIAAGSDQLILDLNPGFSVGDAIIVEVGGESGAGQRGTMGVGGAWPNLSYPNFAALSADRVQKNGAFAYTQDTSSVYYYYNGWSPALATVPTLYYQNAIAPKALAATITAIDGTKVILSRSSVVAATSAKVYFDNTALINGMTGAENAAKGGHPTSLAISWPEGVFAFSDQISIFQINNISWIGQGRNRAVLLSPKGTPSLHIQFFQCTNASAAKFTMRGNFRFNGFGLTLGGVAGFLEGLEFRICNDCHADDITFIDPSESAFSCSYGAICWARNCAVIFNDGLQCYTQWAFDWTDSTGGGFVDCSVRSPTLWRDSRVSDQRGLP